MKIEGMPTHFGLCSLNYAPRAGGATLMLASEAPGGCVLRLPPVLAAGAYVGNHEFPSGRTGEFAIPARTTRVELQFR